MKKKTVAIVAAVALLALAVPALAFAGVMHGPWLSAGSSATAQPALAAQAASTAANPVDRYADADGNGVCDNRENGTCPEPGNACAASGGACAGYVDDDGNGICDNSESGGGLVSGGACAGYADANDDGICDSCAAQRGACPAYIDADNDGVCDNRESGACGQKRGCAQGHDRSRGWGHGRGCMRG